MQQNQELLSQIINAHNGFIEHAVNESHLREFLDVAMAVTASECGIIGEIAFDHHGEPELRLFLPADESGGVNHDSTKVNVCRCKLDVSSFLYQVADQKKPLIINQPELLQQISERPGHIDCALILPVLNRGELVGLLCLFNRTEGYHDADTDFLQPLLDACGRYLRLIWVERENQAFSAYLNSPKRLSGPVSTVSHSSHYYQMIGQSEPMQRLYKAIGKTARGHWSVLVQGETGSGKELVANAVHKASSRADKPFIAINCGGMTESLLTAQLFGSRKGAFTGAVSDQVGFFEAAHGGTLFLDEVGDIPATVQTALLRVLEQGEIQRVGDTKSIAVDVRIIAASHKDLKAEVAAGRFREDLYYRIRVTSLEVPALRQRKCDIPMLANMLLTKEQVHFDGNIDGFSAQAMVALSQYHWPGNVRELRNAVRSAMIQCESTVIEPMDLPKEILDSSTQSSFALPSPSPSLQKLCPLKAALAKANGNRSKAARLLGVSRATFYRRLTEAGIATKTS